MEKQIGITVKKDKNFSEWYTQVIIKSELADYSDVSGCIILRPDAYFIWEQIQQFTDKEFKKVGIQNVYFPLFIPERLLAKEKQHVKGFSPEVAWVTHAGNTKLDEKLAIRPTSETIMYVSFAKWIRSWRDLPLRFNQWNNVVRWEFKHPTPFIRSREFLWNEGHTVFATEKEALAEEKQILNIYKKVTEELLALPSITGRKSDKEKFAGAIFSSTIEHYMPDGKAIQGPDFHYDGQNFAKAFNIKFIDKKENKNYVYQNTWAITTREIGVIIAVHGDDRGLILPPKLAPIQIVIVPIYDSKTKSKVIDKAKKLNDELKEFRTKLDNRQEYNPGWKFNEAELKGIPIRLEIGPKDITKNQIILVRRDTGKKQTVKIKNIAKIVKKTLEEIHKNLFQRAKKLLNSNLTKAKTFGELKNQINDKKLVLAPFCGETKCEESIKDKLNGVKTINIPFNQPKTKGRCIYCNKSAKYQVYFGKSY